MPSRAKSRCRGDEETRAAAGLVGRRRQPPRAPKRAEAQEHALLLLRRGRHRCGHGRPRTRRPPSPCRAGARFGKPPRVPPTFSVQATDGPARAGRITTAHGAVQTPAFMPVGTRAAVTGLTAQELRELGAEMILGNTYHLALRPGPEAMRQLGGLHRFMGWDRGILTDSGGFQIFSLARDRVVNEAGARFRSYIDGREHMLTPESSIAMQEALGSDVMMVLDVCPPSTAPEAEIEAAMHRTHRWALRSLAARQSGEQALFAIVQGGLSPTWRAQSAEFLGRHAFDGFAIGGVAVGDTRSQRGEVIAAAAERLPHDRPRYLMGVGTPPDMLLAIARGVD
ncbi:MAG: tRNA guanosine(34) transglycosylase Tgt, partial [Planctomycetes bacterium]|nr:tRNA guanosine(34) transglycosylase Tgt [Planctomycetota bacterium]